MERTSNGGGCLVYPQDALKLLIRYQKEEKEACDDDATPDKGAPFSNVFFEFANTKRVGYKAAGQEFGLVFDQDENACGHHTGGIIWDSAYVLLNHLLGLRLDSAEKFLLGSTIELGAGVGFLGQCLASEGCCEAIVQTETNEVLIHLERTLKSNGKALDDRDVVAHLLDWTNCETEIAQLNVQTFDTILATDVLFAPDLVEPLLKTAATVSKESTVWFLCVQKRCIKSHDAFLRRAPEFGFRVEDLSDSLDEWGKAVDCVLLRLTRIHVEPNSKQSARKRPKLM